MTQNLGAEHVEGVSKSIDDNRKEMVKVAASLSSLTEKIPTAVQKLIDSNKELSEANSKYAKALCWLTGGLVFVGLLPYTEKLIFILRTH